MSPERPLEEALEEVFRGPLSRCAGQLLPPGDEGGFRTVAELVRPARLGEVLGAFVRTFDDEADPRAITSLWSQWYLGTLVVPSTAAGLRLERVLPLGAGALEVRLDEDRRPVAFRMPHGGKVEPDADPAEHLRPLIRGHLAPLVEALAECGDLSTSLLWCNAARYLHWTFDQLEKLDGASSNAAAGRRSLLEAEAWPDGRPNPLHGQMEPVVEGERERTRRKVCCLRFLIAGVDDCGPLCPLPEVREGRDPSGRTGG